MYIVDLFYRLLLNSRPPPTPLPHALDNPWSCQFDEGQKPPYPFPCKALACGGAFCWVAKGLEAAP